MIDKIFISYSDSEKITWCFWKLFFQICGIWVSEERLEECELDNAQDAHLVIVGNSGKDKIKAKEEKDIFYIVKRNATFSKYKKRADVAEVNWLYGNTQSFQKAISFLFAGKEEKGQIKKILDLYTENEFWGGLWLFQELSVKDKSYFDQCIVARCVQMLNALYEQKSEGDGWHLEYAKLYCEYMKTCSGIRRLTERTMACRELIKKCEQLSAKNGWQPSLCVLMGKIRELSPSEGKFSVFFYKEALKYESKPEILYDIGHIYETMFGDEMRAEEYYIMSVQRDRKFYRGLYKIAFFSEKRGDWKRALNYYVNIENILQKEEKPISIYKAMYLYKTQRRLLAILQKFFAVETLIKGYSKNVEEFPEKKIMENKELDNLFHCMFGKSYEEIIKKEVWKEVLDRLDELCSRM